MASKAGGGIRSKNVTQRPVRYGERAREVRHEGVAQIGTSRGNHATDTRELLRKDVERVRGGLRPAGGPGGIPLGNQTAKECGQGPGGGRVVMRSGSQQQYGVAASDSAPAKNTDILRQFGPDVPGRK
jgi:hypothetical protein